MAVAGGKRMSDVITVDEFEAAQEQAVAQAKDEILRLVEETDKPHLTTVVRDVRALEKFSDSVIREALVNLLYAGAVRLTEDRYLHFA